MSNATLEDVRKAFLALLIDGEALALTNEDFLDTLEGKMGKTLSDKTKKDYEIAAPSATLSAYTMAAARQADQWAADAATFLLSLGGCPEEYNGLLRTYEAPVLSNRFYVGTSASVVALNEACSTRAGFRDNLLAAITNVGANPVNDGLKALPNLIAVQAFYAP